MPMMVWFEMIRLIFSGLETSGSFWRGGRGAGEEADGIGRG